MHNEELMMVRCNSCVRNTLTELAQNAAFLEAPTALTTHGTKGRCELLASTSIKLLLTSNRVVTRRSAQIGQFGAKNHTRE